MRIAQLANFVGPTSGGMKVVIDKLAEGYVDAGHERIFVSPGPRDEVMETSSGIHVFVRAPRLTPQYRMIFKPWRALDVLARFRPDSIEVSDKWTLSPAGRWASRRGVGSVLFSHERLSEMLTDWLRRGLGVEATVGALNRRLAKEFDAVVVTSRFAAEEFDGIGARLELVPLGVDLETFNPAAGEPADDGVLKLCYIGRLSHEKSPQLAVATAVELHRRGRRVRLDVYGTGPDLEELRVLAGDAPVFFHGFVDGRQEVAGRFARSDVSLSVCPSETFGLAVLEAMACGTPVVTANRGGASELVDENSGAQGPPDPAALADAVESLVPRLGPDLRAAARRRAEAYNWSHTVERMLALHEELAERAPYQSLGGFESRRRRRT
ncbi:glycosyltransferase family 1 protein [Tessaracoccus rhinocerotis]|uniref:Glycosyltransferase family 1 protein n=1 Tax=Tessaracoccus rhinocerotis TaxID=1689449 RepID=A0A553K5B6_9ACTN|nr:glycosyltransferase [Tessaracoccus rhinocerotis]TRY19881.1 glycosyltransferase family 1 protein [Tessaracoccus rhinocerotis]